MKLRYHLALQLALYPTLYTWLYTLPILRGMLDVIFIVTILVIFISIVAAMGMAESMY